MLHRNLGFKLLALALAVGLWFVLVVREDMNRQLASAPVGAMQGAPLFGEEGRFARAVPVLPQVQGAPMAGFELVGLRTQPTVVVLSGAEKDLQRVSVVYTQPIPLTNVRGEREVDAVLVVPDKMSVIGEPRVRVTLVVRPLAQRLPAANRAGDGD